MSGLKRIGIKASLAVATLGLASTPLLAFFPPVIAPINRPVTITKDPTPVDPVKVPPVDPCVKPTPKPRPKPTDCGCGTNTGTANTPEPATLVSAGIGLSVASVVGWVKRRRKTVVA